MSFVKASWKAVIVYGKDFGLKSLWTLSKDLFSMLLIEYKPLILFVSNYFRITQNFEAYSTSLLRKSLKIARKFTVKFHF